MTLRLAHGLALPVEAATQTFLVVGKRGSGKSTTCVRLAEQFIKAHVPVVAIDPVDRWWALKAARDGRGPGLSVYVFGGEHADLPLEPTAGALIADTIVEHRISTVLSIKHLSGRERGHFVSDLAGRLFQKNREPLHVFLEEAHEVAPQQPFKGNEEMLGRVTRLWKLGRSSGLGGSAITQRPASLSKNITTQAEILIVHRTLGPQDVAAVREWIRYHGEREDILGQLATLKTGEAFIWAPDFPEHTPIGLQRVQVLDRETFDSTATPKVGVRAVEPKALAPVDLERLRAKMAATLEKAKAEDPRELRREIAGLKAALAKATTAPAIKEKRVEVPVLREAEIKRLVAVAERLGDVGAKATAAGTALAGELAIYRTRLSAPGSAPRVAVPIAARRSVALHSSASLPSGEAKVLTAIAQHNGGVTREQLSILTGYRRSTRDAYVQRLRDRGHVEPAGALLTVTSPGLAALGDGFVPLPTGDALREHWLARLPAGERAVLEVLIAAYPTAVERERISEASGYQRSTRDAYLQRLSARKLVVAVGHGSLRATEELFG